MYFISHSRFIFPTSMNGRMDLIQIIKEAWSGIWMGLRPIRVLVAGCINGAREGGIACLGLHTTVFQAEIYTIKACIMENIEKGYKGRNIYILSDSQAAIQALNNFQINSKLVWDCHQSLMRLAEHNRVKLIWVLGHTEIDGNKMAD
jgi:ribonuclease HI